MLCDSAMMLCGSAMMLHGNAMMLHGSAIVSYLTLYDIICHSHGVICVAAFCLISDSIYHIFAS